MRIRQVLTSVLLAAGLSFFAGPVALAEESMPRVLHGSVPTGLLDQPIHVESRLLQVELTPGIVISAGEGARIAITQATDGATVFAVTVLDGPVIALNQDRNELKKLAVGTHVLGNLEKAGGRSHPLESWVEALDPLPGLEPFSGDPKSSTLLSDGLMVRQQEYLDKLKINVTVINNLVVSLIRATIPRH